LLVVLVVAVVLTGVPQAAWAATVPTITSANHTTFTVGVPGTFTVTTTGSPTPSLSETGTLPSGVTFVDKGNGTATLSGTVPNSSYVGTYPLTISAQNAQGTGTQSFTLTVAAGVLSIGVSSTASLGTAAPGGSVTAHLGTVTITDNRYMVADAWTVTVSSTTFITGGGSAAETVPLTAVSYWSGPILTHSGLGNFNAGQAAASNALALSTSRTASTHTSGNLTSAATFNPTLIITIPAAAVAGTYTGTVTHSVA
jgi:hypothetical protein